MLAKPHKLYLALIATSWAAYYGRVAVLPFTRGLSLAPASLGAAIRTTMLGVALTAQFLAAGAGRNVGVA